MALANYTDLQAAVARWMHRTNLAGDIPDFIALAEARVRALLDAELMAGLASIVTVAGQSSVSLLSDLVTVRSLSIPGQASGLDYVTPEQYAARSASGDAGLPQQYTTIGGQIFLFPRPDAAYTLACAYRAYIPSLSVAVPTNSLLTNWPNIYLWGSLVEAAKFSRDREAQTGFDADFQTAIASVNESDAHRGGQMRVRCDVRPV